jgi:CheY-like chemotaxis protein
MTENPACVLLAEDDRLLRKAAEFELRRHGRRVVTAADGEEALRLARQEKPDLILMDMIMPKMQGFEVLHLLKQEAGTALIPVIVLSNLGQDRDVQEAMKAGAVAYLIKANLSLKDLSAHVDEALKKAQKS